GNVYFGNSSGYNSNGNGNVFIGADAGFYETGSDRLYIENSWNESSGALIYGEFDNDILALNANVGIGTTAPTSKLEVRGATKSITATGTEPGAGQFQSWTDGTTQGQYAVYSFYPTFQATSDNAPRRAADIVSGFDNGSWGKEYLSFNVGNNGSANDNQALTSEKMRIASNGFVGIGTVSPLHLLSLSGGAYCDGTGAWISGSDKSYKKEIKELDQYGIKEILQLQPVTFVHKQDPTNTIQLGFIAQDVIGIIPELVSGTEGNYGLAYDRISVVLVKAIKEQQKIIEKQQAEIDYLKSLENEVSELKSLVNSLIANQTAQVNK
ncbi:MAG: tail fiber domain-containing protein, partial [Bacteroidales bacterium]